MVDSPTSGLGRFLLATLVLLSACSPGGGRNGPKPTPGPTSSLPGRGAPGPRPPTVDSSLPTLTDTQVSGVADVLGSWVLVGRTEVPGPFSDQGLATVTRPDGRTEILYAGALEVANPARSGGWAHVGDPDGWGRWLVKPFQDGPLAGTKMFEVTGPDGAVTRSVHATVTGEGTSNSFAAVDPTGQWTVSAEWGVGARLLVFPTPVLNPAAPPDRPLELAGTIALREPVPYLQGCGFLTETRLVCSAPSQVLQIDLDRPLHPPAPVAATVAVLGAAPASGACPGPYETEGVDVDRALGQLRIAVAPPGICNLLTQVYEYRLRSGP